MSPYYIQTIGHDIPSQLYLTGSLLSLSVAKGVVLAYHEIGPLGKHWLLFQSVQLLFDFFVRKKTRTMGTKAKNLPIDNFSQIT